MMTDMQIIFEYYTRDVYHFDYTKTEEGTYAKRKTATAFRLFCLGVKVGEMG